MGDIEELLDNDLTFEDFKNQNGITFWWASEFMLMLGYDDMKKFRQAIDRATKAFISLGIDQYENIVYVTRETDGGRQADFKLTRFACYLIAMNADPKKPEVARVQAYFAEMTRRFEEQQDQSENLARLLIRDEIKEGNKSLSTAIKQAGVEDYARFMNAGYRGMYNMMNVDLARRRNCEKDKLFETMGRTELAANLFRITQTEERIKSQHIEGQYALESTHRDVGREVREIVRRNTGRFPEDLPQEKQIPDIKRDLKGDFRQLEKIDKKK